MKKQMLVLLCLMITTLGFAQETPSENTQTTEGSLFPAKPKEEEKIDAPKDNPSDEINTLMGDTGHNGFFGALSFKATSFKDEAQVMAGLRGGWIINRTVAIGLEGYGLIPASTIDNIYPEKLRLLGGYGGLFIEPILFSNQTVHVTFPVSGGAGWLGYHRDWENNRRDRDWEDDLISDDVFWYVEPGAALEINLAKNVRINTGLSYRITQDLELLQTSSSEFDGLNYFLSLKVGIF